MYGTQEPTTLPSPIACSCGMVPDYANKVDLLAHFATSPTWYAIDTGYVFMRLFSANNGIIEIYVNWAPVAMLVGTGTGVNTSYLFPVKKGDRVEVGFIENTTKITKAYFYPAIAVPIP
ncbi:hypothetical protein FACS189425_10710 [Clostridia bacterium]|nr:hypothetical protein FACS189425_10710 [Clostridia bacterium]